MWEAKRGLKGCRAPTNLLEDNLCAAVAGRSEVERRREVVAIRNDGDDDIGSAQGAFLLKADRLAESLKWDASDTALPGLELDYQTPGAQDIRI